MVSGGGSSGRPSRGFPLPFVAALVLPGDWLMSARRTDPESQVLGGRVRKMGASWRSSGRLRHSCFRGCGPGTSHTEPSGQPIIDQWLPVSGATGDVVGYVKSADLFRPPPWEPSDDGQLKPTRPFVIDPVENEATEAGALVYDAPGGRPIGILTEEGFIGCDPVTDVGGSPQARSMAFGLLEPR
jgi:hypothetical protein